MSSFFGKKLTDWPKWQLATSLLVSYWVIRFYVRFDTLSGVKQAWPYWLTEIVISLAFFGVWVLVANWLQSRLAPKNFLLSFSLSTQFVSLLLASGLALGLHSGICRAQSVLSAVHSRLQHRAPQVTPTVLTASCLPGNCPQQKFDQGLTVLTILSVFYLTANRRGYAQWKGLHARTEALQQQTEQAHLAALRNQTNPHFLFNNLRFLSTLIRANPIQSFQFIGQLSKSYRYVIDHRDAQSVPLQDELAFLKAYLFLLRMRFGNTFNVHHSISPADAQQYCVVPTTLQILIENALRHNKRTNEVPLLVSIEQEGDYLVVTNLIWPRIPTDPSNGLNLKAICKAYQWLTDRPVLVTNQANVFMVKIPLLPKPNTTLA